MIFKTESRNIEIKGIKLTALITIEINEDQNFEIGDWDLEEDRKRIRSGELFVGSITVIARALGLEGIDSLGGCTIRPNNMFDSTPFNQDVTHVINEYGMVENSLDDLKQAILKQSEELKQFA